jgi:hypothetical protein
VRNDFAPALRNHWSIATTAVLRNASDKERGQNSVANLRNRCDFAGISSVALGAPCPLWRNCARSQLRCSVAPAASGFSPRLNHDGYEEEPHRSAEICVCEIFGRDVTPDRASVGMGVHPFGDPLIVDEFFAETVPHLRVSGGHGVRGDRERLPQGVRRRLRSRLPPKCLITSGGEDPRAPVMRAREHDDCWQGCGPISSRTSRRSRVCGEDHLPGRDA